ncbi:MAG: hydrogenase [Pyramidobacter sp.]|nr:hydrogenase [Pyramidobacter sp.]
MSGVLFTGAGFWSALPWIVLVVLCGVYVWGVRSLGRDDYKEGTAQDEIYYSGNEVPDADVFSVPASSSYWGFREALKGYYARLTAMHTGVGTDYVGWFVVTAAIILVCALV